MEKEFTIVNKLGMHARPAAEFCKTANLYQSEIWVEKGDDLVNGKSIMGLMMLGAGCGSVISISAEGPDAEQALDDLGKLIGNGFTDED